MTSLSNLTDGIRNAFQAAAELPAKGAAGFLEGTNKTVCALATIENDNLLRLIFMVPVFGEYVQVLQMSRLDHEMYTYPVSAEKQNALLNRKVRVLELATQASCVKLIASIALMSSGLIFLFAAETAINSFMAWDQNRTISDHYALNAALGETPPMYENY
jgi:hypothetical protein